MEAAADKAPGARDKLWPSEQLLSDAVGRLMEFWGFKRNMGRIWAVLYLSDEPRSASDLRSMLGMSAGAVSMCTNELQRWGVIKKIWIHGERRDYFVAEGQLWKMISRVFRERELVEVLEAIASLEQALDELGPMLKSDDPARRARAQTQKARIEQLLELARMGKGLLEVLLRSASVDASALKRFLL